MAQIAGTEQRHGDGGDKEEAIPVHIDEEADATRARLNGLHITHPDGAWVSVYAPWDAREIRQECGEVAVICGSWAGSAKVSAR